MVRFRHRGNFNHTEKLFMKAKQVIHKSVLDEYGKAGVNALADSTPVDSGKTRESWDYEIVQNPNGYSVFWTNDNLNEGVSIAVLLQYGHLTGNGGFVPGMDYINPAMRPVFTGLADAAWEEVKSL